MHLNHPQTIPLSLVRENIEETGPWCKKKGWRRLLYRLVSYTTARVVFYNSESKPRTELGTGGSPCNLLWRRCGFKGVVFYMLIRIDPGQEQWWRSGCGRGSRRRAPGPRDAVQCPPLPAAEPWRSAWRSASAIKGTLQ